MQKVTLYKRFTNFNTAHEYGFYNPLNSVRAKSDSSVSCYLERFFILTLEFLLLQSAAL